jgi:hypothetical protein
MSPYLLIAHASAHALSRIQISSSGTVGALLEKSLNPVMQFSLCGQMDYWTNKFTAGVGFTFSQ